jgi:hypothetical protein
MGEVNGNLNQTVGFPDNRTPRNPIPSDAPTQTILNSNPIQTAFNSKNLSDSPPTPTVTTKPVNLPQAENPRGLVINVAGAFGTVKNPA